MDIHIVGVQLWVNIGNGRGKVSGVIQMSAAYCPCGNCVHLDCGQLHIATPELQVWQFFTDNI